MTMVVAALLAAACCLVSGAASSAPSGAASEQPWGDNAARWLQILQQYAQSALQQRAGAGAGVGGSHTPQPFAISLPIGSGSEQVRLPLLVLPVPVPDPNLGCSAGSKDSGALHNAHPDQSLGAHPRPLHLLGPQQADSSGQLQLDQYRYQEPEPEPTRAPLVLYGNDGCGGGYSGAGPVPTARLLRLFRQQEAPDPHLPPALLGPPPTPLPPPEDPQQQPRPSSEYLPPPPLQWDASLHVGARLTVPRIGYTEPYEMWWHAPSGASRLELHDANTTCLRQPLSAGGARLLTRLLDRSGEDIVQRCGIGVTGEHPPLAPPGLPDPTPFTFAGHVTWQGVGAERWTHTVAPGAGEGGAAPGEALVVRHELLVTRSEGHALPLRYSVAMDSSVLGAHTDGYVHHYERAELRTPPPVLFALDEARRCDTRDQLDPAEPEQRAMLLPLREYALPTRDVRHDAAWCRFKADNGRVFADQQEDAMRKNLFVHSRRFVGSCNREGAPFEAEVNFLGDRLDAELDVLSGARYDESAPQPEQAHDFPEGHGHQEDSLPDTFDWRDLGGVTPVLYQGSCSSCWAFAVAGSVEGALYAVTRRLVPLAEQALVDCGHETGAHGCNGTWPVHAYAYVTRRGLPARAEYPPYSERVGTCRAPPVPPVTRASGHVDTPPRSVRALQLAIRHHAPNVVVIDSRPKSYLFYKRGVLRDERCLKGPKRKLNHAVLATGWGAQRGEPHFIMKNTYSARWGDGGYIRMHAPSNTCGHQTVPSYARVQRPDVLRARPNDVPVDGVRP